MKYGALRHMKDKNEVWIPKTSGLCSKYFLIAYKIFSRLSLCKIDGVNEEQRGREIKANKDSPQLVLLNLVVHEDPPLFLWKIEICRWIICKTQKLAWDMQGEQRRKIAGEIWEWVKLIELDHNLQVYGLNRIGFLCFRFTCLDKNRVKNPVCSSPIQQLRPDRIQPRYPVYRVDWPVRSGFKNYGKSNDGPSKLQIPRSVYPVQLFQS